MIAFLVALFEMFYWLFTGGHCLEHLATEKGSLITMLVVFAEMVFEFILCGLYMLWRDR